MKAGPGYEFLQGEDHERPQATGLDYHNGCHASKKAVAAALDALQKIALGHRRADVASNIAASAVDEIKAILGRS